MGIRVTDSTVTSEGTTTELYFNITEFFRWKNGINSQFAVQYYKVKDGDKCQIFEGDLKSTYSVDISATIGTDSIEKAAYDAIGAELKAAGLTVEIKSSRIEC
jgi:hypothetical protein